MLFTREFQIENPTYFSATFATQLATASNNYLSYLIVNLENSCQTLDANGGNFSCIVSWTQLYMVFQLHIVLSCTWVSAGQGSGFSSIRNMFFFYLFSSLYIQCIQHYSTAIN